MSRNETSTAQPAVPVDTLPNETNKPLPLVSSYFLLAITQLAELIIEGDKSAACQLESEIEDQLRFHFRGDALATLMAVKRRERQLAEDFAGRQIDYRSVDLPEPRFGEAEDRIAGLHDASP